MDILDVHGEKMGSASPHTYAIYNAHGIQVGSVDYRLGTVFDATSTKVGSVDYRLGTINNASSTRVGSFYYQSDGEVVDVHYTRVGSVTDISPYMPATELIPLIVLAGGAALLLLLSEDKRRLEEKKIQVTEQNVLECAADHFYAYAKSTLKLRKTQRNHVTVNMIGRPTEQFPYYQVRAWIPGAKSHTLKMGVRQAKPFVVEMRVSGDLGYSNLNPLA